MKDNTVLKKWKKKISFHDIEKLLEGEYEERFKEFIKRLKNKNRVRPRRLM